MWNLLLLLVLAAPVTQFQIHAQSETGVEAPEIREAIARALVAGGMRVVLGGKDQACEGCARVSIVEKRGGTYLVVVEQPQHQASSTLRLGSNTPLLDKARALAVQVRLLTRPHTATPVPPVSNRVARAASPSHPPSRPAPPSRPLVTAPALAVSARAAGPEPSPTAVVPSPEPSPVTAAPSPSPPPAVSTVPKDVPPPPSPPVVPRVPEDAKDAEDPPADDPAEESVRVAAITVEDQVSDPGPSLPKWPYIPLTIGVAAGASAVVCGILARDRYDALADRRRTLADARALRNEGENLQIASFVLGGAALVSGMVSWAGFVQRERQLRPVALATRGGAFIGVAGALP